MGMFGISTFDLLQDEYIHRVWYSYTTICLPDFTSTCGLLKTLTHNQRKPKLHPRYPEGFPMGTARGIGLCRAVDLLALGATWLWDFAVVYQEIVRAGDVDSGSAKE